MMKQTRINYFLATIALFLLTPTGLQAETTIGNFNPERDLYIPQFDSKTDVDDIHSVAGVATMLRDPRLANVNYHAVAGAYGIQEGLYVPSPDLFDLAFGAHWSDAHQHREQSLEKVARLVSEALSGGGHVWVADAGQSDFTADWLKRVNGMNLPVDTRKQVHVVQHSDWNESVTSPEKLEYVRQNADYQRIADGNFAGNGTPGFRTGSDGLWESVLQRGGTGEIWRLAREIADNYNGHEGRYSNEDILAGGMDFSDVSESCWIFGFADLEDARAFFSEFPDSQ